jgi:hypothetical protein
MNALKDLLHRMAVLHKEDLSRDRVLIYVQALSDCQNEEAMRKAAELLQKRSQWFPKPVEIREAYVEAKKHIQPAKELEAGISEEQRMENVRRARELAASIGRPA